MAILLNEKTKDGWDITTVYHPLFDGKLIDYIRNPKINVKETEEGQIKNHLQEREFELLTEKEKQIYEKGK